MAKLPMTRRLSLWAALLVVVGLLGWTDYATGEELSFHVFYLIPIGIAGWNLHLLESLAMATICTLVWYLADFVSGHVYSSSMFAVWNTMMRLASFLALATTISKIRELLSREQGIVQDLQRSIAQVKVLKGFLPICAQCKKMRDEEGQWIPMEVFIQQRSNAQFTHGYCKECARHLLEEAGLGQEADKLLDGLDGG